MDNVTMKRTSSRARVPQQDCHGKECPSGGRNRYYLGKHLTPDSYEIEQLYSIERRRLINRSVHGWGVVYGFALSLKDGVQQGELQIGEGLAFDPLGRELIQTHSTELSLDNFVILDDNGRPIRGDGDLNDRIQEDRCGRNKCWLLTAHYAEKTIGQISIKDPCHCDRVEWDRTCETVIYALQPIDCSKCCEKWKCGLKCNCPPDALCCGRHKDELARIDGEIRKIIETYDQAVTSLERENANKAAEERRAREKQLNDLAEKRIEIEAERHARGGCTCLCEDVTRWRPGGDCPCMVDVDDCTRADLENGIKLACVELDRDKCGRWAIVCIVDACGPRQLVKRNDLLFDLINGCDVTRIIETGWGKWHRRSAPPVPFDEFQKALGWGKDTDDYEYETRDFWVTFSRPVVADTLKPDAFAMAVMTDRSDDFWRTYIRVPITAVETNRDADGFATRAKLVLRTNWLRDAVIDRDHMFAQGRTRVEIEVRCDLIVDCLGQQVDGNSRGLSPYPSGNGSPGGSYFSSFTVGRRVIRERPPKPKPQRPPVQAQPAPTVQSANRIR